MNKSRNQIHDLTMMALFLAIEIVLFVTPFGYLRFGPLSATLMHIPVIVCASVMSTQYGAFLGLVFGISSVINATMTPTVTSFVFSPFVTVAGMSGGFQSLIIAIVPRVLLGVIAGTIYHKMLEKGKGKVSSAATAALVATLCHTFMVLGLIVLFYGTQYSEALGIAQSALMGFMGTVILTNCLPETAIAVAVNSALAKALPNQ